MSAIIFRSFVFWYKQEIKLNGSKLKNAIFRVSIPTVWTAILLGSTHPRRPRGSPLGRKKRRDESFQVGGERAPGYRLSSNYFQKFKRMPAPDWAQKMLCIILPNPRTVSPEFFQWVCTRRLLCCHTCSVRSTILCVHGKFLFSTFLTRNEGTTDESKKRLGCYQQEQFNLPREYSVVTHHNIS